MTGLTARVYRGCTGRSTRGFSERRLRVDGCSLLIDFWSRRPVGGDGEQLLFSVDVCEFLHSGAQVPHLYCLRFFGCIRPGWAALPNREKVEMRPTRWADARLRFLDPVDSLPEAFKTVQSGNFDVKVRKYTVRYFERLGTPGALRLSNGLPSAGSLCLSSLLTAVSALVADVPS